MIYSYKEVIESGPTGSSLTLHIEGCEVLGEVEGIKYLYSELPLDVTLYDPLLDLKEATITPSIKDELRTQRFVQVRKELLRDSIECSIGDVHDILADAMKLIEYNLCLTAYLAKDVWSAQKISEDKRVEYLGRVDTQLELLESPDTTFRGDFVNVAKDLTHILERYSRSQVLVKEQYVNDLAKYGL